jgi:hypothetical protein
VSPYALTITEFKDIWERDASEMKDRAILELSFVYFNTDYKSPYRGYDLASRELKVKKDLHFPEDWVKDIAVSSAEKKYDELQETPSLRWLKSMEASLGRIQQFATLYDPMKDPTGSKYSAILRGMKTIPDIVKGLNGLRDVIEAEQEVKQKARGGHTVGSRELPTDRRKRQ